MQELTKKAVTKLLNETRHALVVEDFEAIEELDAIAKEFAGISAGERRLLNSPYDLHGILFYPITIAKSLWLEERCSEWELDDNQAMQILVWTLTLPLSSDPLEEYGDKKKALKAAKKLFLRLHFYADELAAIIERCTQKNEQTEKRGEEGGKSVSDGYGGIIACLVKEYGSTPEKWMYETSVELIAELMDRFSQRVNAEEAASRGHSASKGKAVAPTPTPRLRALGRFRKRLNELKEEWSDGE